MSGLESNPYAVPPSIASAPTNFGRAVATGTQSAFIFLFSFLSLGSLVKTRSFEFAFLYTREMLSEPGISFGLGFAAVHWLFDIRYFVRPLYFQAKIDALVNHWWNDKFLTFQSDLGPYAKHC